MMIFEILLSLFLLFILLDFNRIDSFLNSGFRKGFLKAATPWMKTEGLDNGPKWDGLKEHDPFMKGLKLWSEYYESIKKWEFMEPSNISFEIAMILHFGSAKEIVGAFDRNSHLLLAFPMIPDLIVERIANLTGHFEDKLILSQEEANTFFKRSDEVEGVYGSLDDLQLIVYFFLKFRFYRQMAQLIIIKNDNKPLNWFHLRRASYDNLIGVFSHLFCLNPEKITDFVGPITESKLFLIAPLVASKNRSPAVIRALISKFFRAKNVKSAEILAQVCTGIYLTDYSDDYLDLYNRNEELIHYMQYIIETNGQQVLKNDSHLRNNLEIGQPASKNDTAVIQVTLKACRIMNLIKLNPSDSQKIIFSIYMDEDPKQVEVLFKFFGRIVGHYKSDFYSDLIQSLHFNATVTIQELQL